MTASIDPDARRSSPLTAWSTRLAAANTGRFTIRELPFRTQINLRGNVTDAAFSAAARGVLGHALPEQPNTWTGDADTQVLWLGPDEWLIAAGDGRSEALASAFRAALRSMHHAVIDVSANRTTIEIAGTDTRTVLAKGCSLDMHARSFGPRSTAQTLLAQTQVILQCLNAPAQFPAKFHLYVRNSFAHYLAGWLLDAAAECAASEALDGGRIGSRLA